MQQTKVSLEKGQMQFIENYRKLGFKDKSSVVRTAIEEYKKLLRKQELIQSANLYAEIYNEDSELQELTDAAIEDWPE
ncbi:MAG: hypothetical protein EPO24_11315 [Bacteroidetes bacterium]|nr:MAG: hypothetical protein EPO24_11315 [Bacteroidota bacterium]